MKFYLPQIDFVCLAGSAQGGQQIIFMKAFISHRFRAPQILI